MKLFGDSGGKLIKKIAGRNKEFIEEILESVIDEGGTLKFDLNGVKVNLGKIKLKLNGNVEVTAIPQKKGR
ncbi:MAG: hypothetical protein HY051_03810 [Candidatus Aenigmarchaeota archaeon]|nr:hypothetical protein [Candidatus Aenigmarchaeota archaeon]